MAQKIYPVSEMFVSPQGEGMYAGVLMQFVRLAGCTVGKPYAKEQRAQSPLLPVYTERCTTWDGREFACDTDYRRKFRYTISDISREFGLGIQHVCITGGEPLMHDLTELVGVFLAAGVQVHIETSGTIPLEQSIQDEGARAVAWMTVSPKLGLLDDMVRRADEIKLLVDAYFDWEKVPDTVKKHRRLYLQPINYEHAVNAENLRRCMELQKRYPNVCVSLQLHKVLEHYLKERVR